MTLRLSLSLFALTTGSECCQGRADRTNPSTEIPYLAEEVSQGIKFLFFFQSFLHWISLLQCFTCSNVFKGHSHTSATSGLLSNTFAIKSNPSSLPIGICNKIENTFTYFRQIKPSKLQQTERFQWTEKITTVSIL